jgi:arylsulfatase A-like enzyme
LTSRPNVVWIVLDTARADAFEPYGAPPGATPAFADLARRGVTLHDVRATASWTLPSHLSMFAGAMPRALGLADVAGISAPSARPIIESNRDRLIVELLHRAGYHTAGVSANAWITEFSGFATGFDRFADVRSGRQAKMSSDSRRARALWRYEALRARVDDGAAAAERQLVEWGDLAADTPFLLFVNLVECHSPYLPPRPYAELSAGARLVAAREASAHLTLEAFWRACVTGEVPSAEALERMRAGYRGAIRYMDAWLGRLLDRLDNAGVLAETLVIVTSDHGENFGEGDLIGHGFSLDERLVNVPFIASGPGSERLRDVTTLAQLPQRLAEIAGLVDHPYRAEDLPPLPAAQLDSPAPPRGDPRTEAAIAAWGLDEAGAERLTMPLTAVVDGPIKMVLRGDREAFHDLRSDPLELTPLSAERIEAGPRDRLRAAAAHPALTARSALLDTAGPAPDDPAAADLEDRMRLLGYL